MSAQRGDLHIDVPLTNVSVAYQNPELIATQVLPVVPVNKKTDKYYTFGKESFDLRETLRAKGAESNRVLSWSVGTGSYSCKRNALNDTIDQEDRDNADAPLKPDVEVTEGLTNQIHLRREYDVASYLFNTTTFSGKTSALSGTDQWSDYTNSDPLANIETRIDTIQQASGAKPNTVVMGYEVFMKLKHHPDLLERIKYTQKGILDTDLIATLMGVDRVLVGRSLYNTSTENQTRSLSYAWGKYVLICYVTNRPALKSPSLGYIFTWKNYGGKTAKVKKWREEKIDADIVEVEQCYDVKGTALDAAYLYSTVVA